MKKILIIIPAYNEEESIDSVIGNLENKTGQLQYRVDYLVVNDCSKDSTLTLLEKNDRRYVSLPINLGIGGGVQAGYMYALRNDYDVAIQMDGDGQHDPEYLDRLVEPILQDECDLTIGSRFIDKEGFQSTGLRRFGIKWLSGLIRISGRVKVLDVTSGYRAAGRKVIALFAEDYAQDYPEPESIVMCSRLGCRIKEIPVIMQERQGGVSSISPLKSVYYMIKVSMAILFAGIIY